MIRFVICLIIVVLLYNLIITTISNSCINDNEKITVMNAYGSRISENTFFKKMGFNMARVLLDRELPCGYYEAKSHNGPVVLIIGKSNRREAMLNFVYYKPELETAERFEFWNLNRISNVSNDIINTYNKGCCS